MIASVGTAVSLPVPASGLNFVGEGFHVLFVLVESYVFWSSIWASNRSGEAQPPPHSAAGSRNTAKWSIASSISGAKCIQGCTFRGTK